MILTTCSAFEASHPGASQRILALLPSVTWLCRCSDGTFPDGEIYAQLPGRADGAHVLILQSLSGAEEDLHTALLALLVTVRAYRQYGAAEVTVFVPHLPYSREDRPVEGEYRSTTAALVADLLRVAGADRIVTIQSGSVDVLSKAYEPLRLSQASAIDFFRSSVSNAGFVNPVLVAPDAGSAGLVAEVARTVGLDYLVAEKRRLGASTVTVTLEVDRDSLAGRDVLILDDLVCSAGTMKEAVDALEVLGASRIAAAAAHLRLTETGRNRVRRLLSDGRLENLAALDTYPDPSIARVSTTSFVDGCAEQLRPLLAPASDRCDHTDHSGVFA
ncbi:ribose-phosphate pyrophosphokinase [Rathayibacter agropyri]